MNAIIVYPDRIVIPSIFGDKSFPMHSVQRVSLRFMGGVTLTLADGTESPWLPLSGQGKHCKALIEQYVAQTREAMGFRDAEVVGCTVLGGTSGLKEATKCLVAFSAGDVRFLVDGAPAHTVPIEQITALRLGGPGKVVSGGGFVGGGVGLEGAALGMAAASLLNSLTTESEVNTVIYVSWPSAEVFLHTSRFTPDEGRVKLSRTYTAIEVPKKDQGPMTEPVDLASQLERLASLRDRGLLTSEEFALAKKKVLDGAG